MDLSAKVDAAKAAIDLAIGRHERIFVAFSGGKDSLALLSLLEDWADRVTLIWSHTSHPFPHMVDFVRDFGSRFRLVELVSDLAENWRVHGFPAELVPIANALPSGCHIEPKIQAWTQCCFALRTLPMIRYLEAIPGPVALFHGQRFEERAPLLSAENRVGIWPPNVELIAPIADWLSSDVFAYLEGRGIVLPKQYPAVSGSLECWPCTANYTTEGAAFQGFMRREYPEEMRVTQQGLRKLADASRGVLSRLEAALAPIDHKPLEFVPQRGNADCAIAALATVTGATYEEAAALMGFPCTPDEGLTTKPETRGIQILELGGPLFALGWAATPLVAETTVRQHAGPPIAGLPASKIRALIQNRRAIVVAPTTDGSPELHAFAWTGTQLIDCRGEDAPAVTLEDIELAAAVVLTPLDGR